VIFHDATLRSIAEQQPRNTGELASINGVGSAKLTRYGADVIDTINRASDPTSATQ
jgi:ATP-dependent DNA helicase RecQ